MSGLAGGWIGGEVEVVLLDRCVRRVQIRQNRNSFVGLRIREFHNLLT